MPRQPPRAWRPPPQYRGLHVAHLAITGLGVAVVSSWTVQDDIRRRLVAFTASGVAALPVHLVYPWSRYYPARLRRFLELMRQIMPEVTGMKAATAAIKSRPEGRLSRLACVIQLTADGLLVQ